MRNLRRIAWPVFATAALGALCGATAWACIAGPLLSVNPSTVRAGQEVSFFASRISAGTRNTGGSIQRDPITIYFDGLEGPVLGTFQPGPDPWLAFSSTSRGLDGVKLTIPADAKPGPHVLILTQHSADGKLSQVPSRVLVNVTGPSGATPVGGAPVFPIDETRSEGLIRDQGASAGTKVLVGLGVAGVGLFLAGLAAVLAGGRPAGTEQVATPIPGTK